MAVADFKADGVRNGSGFLTLREAVRVAGCHPNTIRRSSDAGELQAFRLPSGHRRWRLADLLEWIGVENPGDEAEKLSASQVIIYGRVSSHKQSKGLDKGNLDNDLTRQINRLKKISYEQYKCKEPIVYSDTGSGLSFSRKGLIRLVNDILAGKYNHSILLCSFKDRLARFGTEIILQICKYRNVEVVFTEKGMDESAEKELADDILSILTHFSARRHGARSAKTLSKPLAPATLKRAKELLDSGLSTNQVQSQLKKEGYTTEDGSKLTPFLMYKYVFRKRKILAEILPNRDKTNIEEYIDSFIIEDQPHARISTKSIYEHYVKWCSSKGEIPAKINRFSQRLGKRGYSTDRWYGDGKPHKGYSGIIVRGEMLHNYLKQIRRGSRLERKMESAMTNS